VISLAARDKGYPRALFDQFKGMEMGHFPPVNVTPIMIYVEVSSRPITLRNIVYPKYISHTCHI